MATKRITLTLPGDMYSEVVRAKEEKETIANFVRRAIREKLEADLWRRNLENLRQEIREAGGLRLQGSKEEVIEHLRKTRREIFEAEYAHLYR